MSLTQTIEMGLRLLPRTEKRRVLRRIYVSKADFSRRFFGLLFGWFFGFNQRECESVTWRNNRNPVFADFSNRFDHVDGFSPNSMQVELQPVYEAGDVNFLSGGLLFFSRSRLGELVANKNGVNQFLRAISWGFRANH